MALDRVNNDRQKIVWTDSLIAGMQLYAGADRLGINVSGLEDPLLKEGLKYRHLYNFRASAEGVSPEIARASVNTNLDRIRQEGLDVDFDLIMAGARAVSETPRAASIRANIVAADAAGKLHYNRR